MLEGFCGMDNVCGWQYIHHIINREAIHIASGAGASILFLTAWNELAERGVLWKLRGYSFYALPSITAALLIFLREPLDVAHGDSWVKSFIDLSTWCLSIAVTNIGLFRLTPRLREVRVDIMKQRDRMELRKKRAQEDD